MAELWPSARVVVRAMRPHHWVKNLLVFVPVLAAHRWDEPDLWFSACLAFCAFCFCSSAIYLTNDLLDVKDDRAHPIKRLRPVASGQMRPNLALALAALLAATGLALAAAGGATLMLLVYCLGSLAYSAWLKTLPGVDVLTLVALYAIRLLAGGDATGIAVSGWLLAFGSCIFTSLALAKRASELHGVANGALPAPQRRGYRVSDGRLLSVLGLLSAFGSFVVLLFYLQDSSVRAIYRHPEWLALAGGVVLLWLLRVWRLVSAGRVHADPVVFAMKDLPSLLAGVGVVVLLVFAAS